MLRLVATAFGILLVCLNIGCGGAPGTSGPNGNGGGSNGTTMREVRIDSPACQVQSEPSSCAYEVVNRTQNNNPTVEFKIWAADCSRNILNPPPIAGAERSFYAIEQLQQMTSLTVPSRGKISIVGKLTYMDQNGMHEWAGVTECRDMSTIESHTRITLLLAMQY